MPFTPFHLGPGLAIKALAGERFSLLIFGGTQILMDIEPLVRIVRHDPVLHGPTHSIAGAIAIGLVAAAIGKPLSDMVLRQTSASQTYIGWPVALASALLGTFTHIALDAIMHRDMRPAWPLSRLNPLLEALPLGALHLLCLGLGLLGGAILARKAWMRA